MMRIAELCHEPVDSHTSLIKNPANLNCHFTLAGFFANQRLHIKLEQHDIAVPHDIFFASLRTRLFQSNNTKDYFYTN